MRHIVTMTSAGAAGLMALFVVDLVDMYFISLLGDAALAAAIGYAGTILFFTTSISIGASIATGVLVSQKVGLGDEDDAKALAVDNLIFGGVATGLIAVVIWIFIPEILMLLGAKGLSLDYSTSYLRIVIPTMPVMSTAMIGGAILRGIGDAKAPMFGTLTGGVVNAVLDPILIFGLDLGVDGAAWASFVSRLAIAGVISYGVVSRHRFVVRPSILRLKSHIPIIVAIAVPAVLTNIATPVGNAYVTWSLAPHGDSVMAGWAVIGRVIPFAFGVIFALSGAIGPIYGQNYGAKRYDRVLQTYSNGLIFISIFVIAVTIVLFAAQDFIILSFALSAEGAALTALFCTWLAPSFAFTGVLFVSNAAFNNLGRPKLATYFNWGRASLGTVPFVLLGDRLAGAAGILIGFSAGAIVFGLGSIWMGYRIIHRCGTEPHPPSEPPLSPRRPLWPFSSRRV